MIEFLISRILRSNIVCSIHNICTASKHPVSHTNVFRHVPIWIWQLPHWHVPQGNLWGEKHCLPCSVGKNGSLTTGRGCLCCLWMQIACSYGLAQLDVAWINEGHQGWPWIKPSPHWNTRLAIVSVQYGTSPIRTTQLIELIIISIWQQLRRFRNLCVLHQQMPMAGCSVG